MSSVESVYRCICQNLIEQRDHVARVIGGAACEPWFSCEAFVAINWPVNPLLGTEFCAIAEDRKRDLIVRDDTKRTIATVESKVVYNNKNLSSALADLRGKVERNSYDDEVPNCRRAGMMYVVWLSSFTRREVKTQPDYHAVVIREIDRLFSPELYEYFPSEGLDEVVATTELPWPGQSYRVSLHTKLMQRKC